MDVEAICSHMFSYFLGPFHSQAAERGVGRVLQFNRRYCTRQNEDIVADKWVAKSNLIRSNLAAADLYIQEQRELLSEAKEWKQRPGQIFNKKITKNRMMQFSARADAVTSDVLRQVADRNKRLEVEGLQRRQLIAQRKARVCASTKNGNSSTPSPSTIHPDCMLPSAVLTKISRTNF